ncbi:Rne/Rng family ribonuclease [Humidisolicoccus flavus]|uniref:Rne/Rng family ribonuclease n=1 Tax=Humidisolicoccus flavus TaxID=3111414 RepID=UPI003249A690
MVNDNENTNVTDQEHEGAEALETSSAIETQSESESAPETKPKRRKVVSAGRKRATKASADAEATKSESAGSSADAAAPAPDNADEAGAGAPVADAEPASAAESTSTESTAAESSTAESATAESATAEPPAPVTTASAPAATNSEPVEGLPSAATAVEPELLKSEATPSTPAPVSPMALIFQAPDLDSLPPLPPRRAEQPASDPDDEGGSTTRRRSRERRSREDDRPVVTEPQKVKGSTRLEAKKQRRRDGRDAGRRRSVVTESEFLARRESVDRTMVVRSKHDRVQLGVLEDGVLVEHYVAKSQESSLIGNVYLGRVQNVLPSMEAAFVDIGRGRNAVLYSGEVDWDAVENTNQPRRIELALKPGDTVLVQVTKDPVGHKGARLTSQISLPGRYLVSVPGGSMSGISRKLPDTERARLKKILKQVLPGSFGVIVRTAAEGATEEQLTRDVERLTKQWERIQELQAKGNAPQRLHAEPDLLVKIIRDVFNEDFQKLVIHGDEALATISEYLETIAPDLLERVEKFEGDDPFDTFRITEQIEKALDRKVWLPSGGSLVIDRTEAMTVVDVNTGRFVGQGGNLEETVTKNNLEAAEEIVKQLRLRDIGGIIVIDFIDMVLETNRDLVLRRLVECLSRDRTKHQVAEVTSLGLVQMTRKKLGLGLLEAYSEPCETCAGRGLVVFHEPVARARTQANDGNSRRRGGKGNNNGHNNNGHNNAQQSSQKQQQQGTHAITEDARKGLSQVAMSTSGKRDDESSETASEEPSNTQNDTSAAASDKDVRESTEQTPKRGRKNRRSNGRGGRDQASRDGQSSNDGEHTNEEQSNREGDSGRGRRAQRDASSSDKNNGNHEPAGHESSGAAANAEPAAQAPVRILDIDVPPVAEPQTSGASVKDLDGLLGGALDALSAPKAGEGKSARRSRRASSGVITGAASKPIVVDPNADNDQKNGDSD